MIGSRVRLRAGHALLGAVTSVVVGAAAVIAFQGHAPGSAAITPRSDARIETATSVRPHALTPNITRGYTATQLALFLDGAFMGYARAVDGCTWAGDVVTTVDDRGVSKELTGFQMEPCVIEHGRMVRQFETWIANQVNAGGVASHDTLDIYGIDAGNVPVAAVRVVMPLLIGFQLDAVDAASRNAAYFHSTIDGTRIQGLDPARMPATGPGVGPGKALLASQFKLTVNRSPVPGAARVSPITLARSDRDQSAPGPWVVSNIQVFTAMSQQAPFPTWYASAVADPSRTLERAMTLRLLGVDLVTTLFQFNLGGVGIFRADDGLLGTRRMFSLYAETATVAFP